MGYRLMREVEYGPPPHYAPRAPGLHQFRVLLVLAHRADAQDTVTIPDQWWLRDALGMLAAQQEGGINALVEQGYLHPPSEIARGGAGTYRVVPDPKAAIEAEHRALLKRERP